MSLKTVHLVFILAAIGLAAWVAVWCMQRYGEGGGSGVLMGGIGSAIAGAALVWYGVRFVQKFRDVRYY